MAQLISIPHKTDHRGSLAIIEKILPFDIKRVFYIYNVPVTAKRGGHRHKKTRQALICLNGSCVIFNDNQKEKKDYLLNDPAQCLIIEPEDWHQMHSFSKGAVLLVLASEHYDEKDYIHEAYQTK